MESLTAEVVSLWPTLSSCYQPVEKYRQLLAATGGPCSGAIEFQALDAYLLWQITAALPAPPTVIDLSAQATGGATAAFWLASPVLKQYFAPSDEQTPDACGWRAQFQQVAAELDIKRPLPPAADLASVTRQCATHAPVLVLCAVPEAEAHGLAARLERVLQFFAQSWICLWPLGEIGRSELLAAALDFCRAQPRYRLTALRETSPFLATSTLGLICPADDAMLPRVEARLRQAYEGNYQFLALACRVNQLAVDCAEAERARLEATQRFQEQTAAHELEIARLTKELNTAPTLGKLYYEGKRWLWHRIFPSGLKRWRRANHTE